MVKTGQFTTRCEDDRVSSRTDGKNHFGRTPPRTLSTPLPAKSCQKSYLLWMWLYHVINGYSSNTSREQNHQLPHDFAGKGVLNVLGVVLPKWLLSFRAMTLVVNWPVFTIYIFQVSSNLFRDFRATAPFPYSGIPTICFSRYNFSLSSDNQ